MDGICMDLSLQIGLSPGVNEREKANGVEVASVCIRVLWSGETAEFVVHSEVKKCITFTDNTDACGYKVALLHLQWAHFVGM